MERIKLSISTYWYVSFIPPRCRKPRFRKEKGEIKFSVRSVSSDEAPIAFRLSDYHHKRYGKTVIRFFKGKFYRIVVYEDLYCGGERKPVKPTDVAKHLHPSMSYNEHERTKEHCANAFKQEAKRLLVIDGEAWEQCGEPMYQVCTFGLGHNHGGTGLFVEHFYNPNIPNRNYFSALDGDRAVAYANEVAQRRGDTKDVGKFEKMIEVLMPQCVKAKPMKQHGKGDPFNNKLNAITERSSSVLEAGLLAICAAFS